MTHAPTPSSALPMEVHRQLGCGFLEAVYQEALELELRSQGIPYQREVQLQVTYRGQQLKTANRADFICYDSVIVEMKALGHLGGTEESQVLNYLRAARLEVGILLNFGASSLEYKRFVFSPSVKSV